MSSALVDLVPGALGCLNWLSGPQNIQKTDDTTTTSPANSLMALLYIVNICIIVRSKVMIDTN